MGLGCDILYYYVKIVNLERGLISNHHQHQNNKLNLSALSEKTEWGIIYNLFLIYMWLLHGVGSWYAVPLCKNSEFGGGLISKSPPTL